MKEIELQISQFIDNELNDAEQKELFIALSENEEARLILSDFMQLKKDTNEYYSNLKTELSPVPAHSAEIKTRSISSNKYKTMFYLSLAASIVLGMLLFRNQSEKEKTFSQLSSLEKQYAMLKSEYVKALSVPKTEPAIKNIATPSKTISRDTSGKKKNQLSSLPRYMAGKPDRIQGLNNLTELLQNSRVSIDKEDFIGGQIVGN